MASPPGRFSTTTVWPHFAVSLSANSRAVISTPEPGPSGMMNLTTRCGQAGACADDNVEDSASATMRPMKANDDDRSLCMGSPDGSADNLTGIPQMAPNLTWIFAFFRPSCKTVACPLRVQPV